MSADNGIYILKAKDQFRVVHAQAIENVYGDCSYSNNILNPLEVVRIWGNCRYTRHLLKAMTIAVSMDREYQTEYGIKVFEYKKTWKHICEDAKRRAEVELENIKNKEDSYSRWKVDICKNIISKY